MLHTIGHPIPCTRPKYHIKVLPQDTSTRTIAASCGHREPQYIRLEIEDVPLRLPDGVKAGPTFGDIHWLLRRRLSRPCADCLSEEVYKSHIICPCRQLIATGEWVGLEKTQPNYRWPLLHYAARSVDQPELMVTCMECAPGHHSGIWSGDSINSPFPSNVIVLSGAGHAGRSPKGGVIIT